jgi:guanylate kinase
VNDELQSIRKKVANVETIFWNIPEVTEEDREEHSRDSRSADRGSKRIRPKCKSEGAQPGENGPVPKCEE